MAGSRADQVVPAVELSYCPWRAEGKEIPRRRLAGEPGVSATGERPCVWRALRSLTLPARLLNLALLHVEHRIAEQVVHRYSTTWSIACNNASADNSTVSWIVGIDRSLQQVPARQQQPLR